jgi:DNA-binding NarL/FixJ family response regulator
MNKRHINVLVVEDRPEALALVLRTLRRLPETECDVRQTGWLNEARTFLMNPLPGKTTDIVLLDLSLPDSGNGIDTVTDVVKTAPTVPVLVMSGREDLAIAIEAAQAGAQGFVCKSDNLSPHALEREIHNAITQKTKQNVARETKLAARERLSQIDRDTPIPASPKAELLSPLLNVVTEGIRNLRKYIRYNLSNSIHRDNIEQLLLASGIDEAVQEAYALLHTHGVGSGSEFVRADHLRVEGVVEQVPQSERIKNDVEADATMLRLLRGGDDE